MRVTQGMNSTAETWISCRGFPSGGRSDCHICGESNGHIQPGAELLTIFHLHPRVRTHYAPVPCAWFPHEENPRLGLERSPAAPGRGRCSRLTDSSQERAVTSPIMIPFGLDTFTGICPGEFIIGVKFYLYFRQQVTCDDSTISKTTSTSTEKQIASHSLNKMCRKHHQIITTYLLRDISQSKWLPARETVTRQ